MSRLSEDEIRSPEIFFSRMEQAYWYYEDKLRLEQPQLPSFSSLKLFSEYFINLKPQTFSTISFDLSHSYNIYQRHRARIPACGGILLNKERTKFLLVRDFYSKSWMFPRGKNEYGESDMDCAVREVREETGYDMRENINESDVFILKDNAKTIKLYIARDVPEDFPFKPQTIKEISNIQFFDINNIPANSFHVLPVMNRLREWLLRQNDTRYSNSSLSVAPWFQFQFDVKRILSEIDRALHSTDSA